MPPTLAAAHISPYLNPLGIPGEIKDAYEELKQLDGDDPGWMKAASYGRFGASILGAVLAAEQVHVGSPKAGGCCSSVRPRTARFIGLEHGPTIDLAPPRGTTRIGKTPLDLRISPKAPAPRPVPRPIGKSQMQQIELLRNIQEAIRLGAADIRVNQQQLEAGIGAAGKRVGINKPDLQFTLPSGHRVHIEYDTTSSTRGIPHANRILANDCRAIVILKVID